MKLSMGPSTATVREPPGGEQKPGSWDPRTHGCQYSHMSSATALGLFVKTEMAFHVQPFRSYKKACIWCHQSSALQTLLSLFNGGSRARAGWGWALPGGGGDTQRKQNVSVFQFCDFLLLIFPST